MNMQPNTRWTERVAERLRRFGGPEPRHLDELPMRAGPTGAETALDAAFLVRLVHIADEHKAAAATAKG